MHDDGQRQIDQKVWPDHVDQEHEDKREKELCRWYQVVQVHWPVVLCNDLEYRQKTRADILPDGNVEVQIVLVVCTVILDRQTIIEVAAASLVFWTFEASPGEPVVMLGADGTACTALAEAEGSSFPDHFAIYFHWSRSESAGIIDVIWEELQAKNGQHHEEAEEEENDIGQAFDRMPEGDYLLLQLRNFIEACQQLKDSHRPQNAEKCDGMLVW